MRLELSMLDDDEDEKIETVQRGSRRELAQKRVLGEKAKVMPKKSTKVPSITVSEDVYQTLHTMGKFLTQNETTLPEEEFIENQKEAKALLDKVQEPHKREANVVNSVLTGETIETKISEQLGTLIEEVQEIEEIVKVDRETLVEEIETIVDSIQPKLEQEITKVQKSTQEEKLKEAQNLVDEIKNVRKKSKAQIEAIVNNAVEESQLESALEQDYNEEDYFEEDKPLKQNEIDKLFDLHFKHRTPDPIYANINLEDLKTHIEDQILLIKEYGNI